VRQAVVSIEVVMVVPQVGEVLIAPCQLAVAAGARYEKDYKNL